MTNILYQSIDDLVQDNAGLTIKLQLAKTEIGSLKLEIERLEGGHLALTVKLQDANNEVARMGMVLKHQVKDLESIRRSGK